MEGRAAGIRVRVLCREDLPVSWCVQHMLILGYLAYSPSTTHVDIRVIGSFSLYNTCRYLGAWFVFPLQHTLIFWYLVACAVEGRKQMDSFSDNLHFE